MSPSDIAFGQSDQGLYTCPDGLSPAVSIVARWLALANDLPKDEASELTAMVSKLMQETIAVAQRIWQELLRRRRSLIFWAVFPVLMLVMNSLILAERAQLATADAYQQAAAPTLVGAALFFSCLGGSVATVVAEREQQTLKRLFLAPLSGFSYFLGIFIAHCGIGAGAGAVGVGDRDRCGLPISRFPGARPADYFAQHCRLCRSGLCLGHPTRPSHRRRQRFDRGLWSAAAAARGRFSTNQPIS